MGNTGEVIDKDKLAHTSHISSEAGLNLALALLQTVMVIGLACCWLRPGSMSTGDPNKSQ